MANEPLELLQGTLDVLILKTLTWGPMHGYGVAHWIRQKTSDELRIEDGALYTALHRLEQRKWVASEWGVTQQNRRAKFYSLTKHGRTALAERTNQWTRYANAVSRILRPA
ncbi:MAG TPA: PadR family transcriptional regulator [Gemmatimonadaceae bacterium]|nr:PadR family transcriptional regulator [Gemmatimonadaceae bacterium]